MRKARARCTACKLRKRIRGRIFCKECIEGFQKGKMANNDEESENPEFEFTKEFNKEVDEDDY